MKATDTEISEHINAMMNLLRWFHDHSVRLHISPSEKGWNIKFTVPDSEGGP